MENPGNRENTGEKIEIKRNPDGTFPPGVSGNPNGRPKGTLKDYLRRKFLNMSEEEKESFLKEIPPVEQFRMAEGNPHQTNDIAAEITMPKPLLNVVRDNNSDQEGLLNVQEDTSDPGRHLGG